ncbi:methyltransferase [Haloprofundus marisrubri]|uniref:Methyltransferase n=1 Tax=Haloprofundus marisrubri TaxID=1514971 RepID=A0A0W1R6G9_9EURY|nr:HemK2/MTQ2 family protein methyltransferase [Haloprofundus marisrubri]KTG08655.1 methyltransferase [Haloprofundus marisrubri]
MSDEKNRKETTTRDSLAERRGVETHVYQPAEDSGLLAKAAVEHAHGRTLEVGTGSGWVAAKVAAETDADVVASDLNPHACEQAKARADELQAERKDGFDVVRADLFSPFVDGAFDTVLFNPPYLPTDPDNEWSDWMEVALSGGESGRELIDPFVDDVGRVLADGGQALLLVSSLSGYDEVVERAEDQGFDVDVVAEESYPFETLSILRLRL